MYNSYYDTPDTYENLESTLENCSIQKFNGYTLEISLWLDDQVLLTIGYDDNILEIQFNKVNNTLLLNEPKFDYVDDNMTKDTILSIHKSLIVEKINEHFHNVEFTNWIELEGIMYQCLKELVV